MKGRNCPECDGIDTTEVLPGLITCHDCGDEFEVGVKKRDLPQAFKAGAEVVPPPSPSAPALFPGYFSRPQPC